MRRALCAGFGQLIGQPDLGVLRELGARLIRHELGDVNHGPNEAPTFSATQVRDVVDEVRDSGIAVLWLVSIDTLRHAPECSECELLNEPDLAGWSPAQYAQLCYRALQVARDRGITLWIGGVSNISAPQQEWLRQVLLRVPQATHVAVHRYPPRDQKSLGGLKGFKSRVDETASLKRILDSRRFAVTEFGFHTAPYSPINWLRFVRKSMSDDEVRVYTAREFAYWEAHGADIACLYQFQDDPRRTDKEGRFGIRRADKSLKPVAGVFA